MLMICVKCLPPTVTKSPRWMATDGTPRNVTMPYRYRDEDAERIEVAEAFRAKYLPGTPELDHTPQHFKGDTFYVFKQKPDLEKLDQIAVNLVEKYRAENKLEVSEDELNNVVVPLNDLINMLKDALKNA